MLTATLLALGAAVLHAAWNLAIKVGGADRFLLLWGQFFLSGIICAPIVVIGGGIPAMGWIWVAISGSVHLPYAYFLAKAYNHGDFSLVYPIARGGGALLAAVGGVVFLGDHLSLLTSVGIAVIGLGLFLLSGLRRSRSVWIAAVVAVTISVYSVVDAHGIRTTDTPLYALAGHLGTTTSTTAFELANGRFAEMRDLIAQRWRRLLPAAIASTVTYFMVQLAFQRAAVGYVTALRESSVVLAAYVGWKRLGERAGGRRLAAAIVVLIGLLVLVAGRK